MNIYHECIAYSWKFFNIDNFLNVSTSFKGDTHILPFK